MIARSSNNRNMSVESSLQQKISKNSSLCKFRDKFWITIKKIVNNKVNNKENSK